MPLSTPMHRELPDLQAQGFQQAFTSALLRENGTSADTHPGLLPLFAQPAFAVYRNTVFRGCVDALLANFPCVARLVGLEWFRAAAAHYAAQHPPGDGRLLYYGASFPAYLGQLPSTTELPYLEGVALLDDAFRHALGAADAPMLEPASLALCSADVLATTVLRPHPATRWHHFHAAPAFAIWQREHAQLDGLPGTSASEDIPWVPDGALITRVHDTVQWQALDAAGCAFLDACAAGQPLQQAADHALAVQADTDLAQLLHTLLCAGAFQGPSP